MEKEENVLYNTTELVPEIISMMELADRNIKTAIIIMNEYLKEDMNIMMKEMEDIENNQKKI